MFQIKWAKFGLGKNKMWNACGTTLQLPFSKKTGQVAQLIDPSQISENFSAFLTIIT